MTEIITNDRNKTRRLLVLKWMHNSTIS